MFLLRVRYLVRLPSKSDKLFLAPLGDGFTKFRIFKIREVKKRGGGAELFTLEKHRDERRGEHERSGDFGAAFAGFVTNALSLGPVAYLVVILHKADETMP